MILKKIWWEMCEQPRMLLYVKAEGCEKAEKKLSNIGDIQSDKT